MSRLLGLAVCGLGVYACADDGVGDPVVPGDDVGANEPIGQVDGPYVEWNFCEGECRDSLRGSISLREVACSASVSCSDALLFDAELNRRPTLVTGFACMFPTEQPADAMLGFHPVLTCYASGAPEDPRSWAGGEVVALDDGQHLFFSEADHKTGGEPGSGRSWLDSARHISMMRGYAFCELTAYGFVAFSDADDEPRRAFHEHHAPIVEWRAVVEPELGDGDYDCHTEPGGLAWVRRRVVRSVTHDRPDELMKGRFPATHDIVMIDDRDRLEAVVVRGSTFPEAPDAMPVPFARRELDRSGLLKVGWSCADVVGGVVERIAILLEGQGLGAIMVERRVEDELGARDWDCARDRTGQCVIVPDDEVMNVAPCLLPIILSGE